MKIDFDALCTEERRLILVASDDRYRALVAQIDFKKLLTFASPLLVGGVLGASVAASAYLARTFGAVTRSLGGKGVQDERPLLERLVTKGEIPLPHLSPIEAARRFRFDLGDPEDGTAYVLHPCVPDRYLRPSLANERLAQEKVAAFMQIASSLGAKRIEVVSADLLERGGSGTLRSPLPDTAAQVGLGVRFDQRKAVTRQVFMELDPPRQAPHVDREQQPFLDLDPVLGALVKSRLDGRARTARVALQVGEILDLDGHATAELEGRGIQVGGRYRKVAAASFAFEIEFWPFPG
jgi:hypothetical protein